MKWRKSFAYAVSVLLIGALALAGCGKNSPSDKPEVSPGASSASPSASPDAKDEKITLKVAAMKTPVVTKDYNEMDIVKKWEEATNVHADWTIIARDGWDEKKNLMFASNDLPDVFYGTYALSDSDVLKYGAQGMLVPLNDLIDQYAPNLKKLFDERPDLKKAITTPDGNIYGLPSVNEDESRAVPEALLINKEWLDKLNLPIPTTTEEFYQTLKAFKDNNLSETGKTYPFSFRDQRDTHTLFSMYGSFGIVDTRNRLFVEGDKVLFVPATPQYKEGVAYFARLYKDGLIDPESFTQNGSVYYSKIKNKQVGAAVLWSNDEVFGEEDQSPYVPIPPLKGPNGQQMWQKIAAGIDHKASFAITSANKYPERTIQWIDYVYGTEQSFEFLYGPIGQVMKQNEDGTYEYVPLPAGENSMYEYSHKLTPGDGSVYAVLSETTGKVKASAPAITKREQYNMYEPFLPKQIYPSVYFTLEDQDKLGKIRGEMDTYMTKMHAKWIVEGNVDKDWDDYLNQLKKMGLDEMMQIYQETYDRYINTK